KTGRAHDAEHSSGRPAGHRVPGRPDDARGARGIAAQSGVADPSRPSGPQRRDARARRRWGRRVLRGLHAHRLRRVGVAGRHEDDQVSLSLLGLRHEGWRARARGSCSATASGVTAQDRRRGAPRLRSLYRSSRFRTRRRLMTSPRSILVSCLVLVLGLSPAMLTAQSSMSVSAVTDARLLNPEPQNWLMYRGNYAGW